MKHPIKEPRIEGVRHISEILPGAIELMEQNQTHFFDVDEAKEFGIAEAVFLGHLRHQILENKTNHRHFYEGRTWTYNSVRAYSELFPYWTEKQVRRIIQNLIEKGVIISGEFNQDSYNHTKWYALADERGQTVLPPPAESDLDIEMQSAIQSFKEALAASDGRESYSVIEMAKLQIADLFLKRAGIATKPGVENE